MEQILNEYELRVLGVVVEKQISTPDYYPLTLNAITNACNQKNHRDPVVSYDEATVIRALDGLREKKLAYTFHGAEARVTKYGHLFPKAYELDEAETAVMCVLILRGPQTPGELRSRTAHLHNFEQLSEVETALQNLSSRQQPLIARLPRLPGARESRYAHLLAGHLDLTDMSESIASAKSPASTAYSSSRVENDRINKLEAEISSLRQELAELKDHFANFKKQFD